MSGALSKKFDLTREDIARLMNTPVADLEWSGPDGVIYHDGEKTMISIGSFRLSHEAFEAAMRQMLSSMSLTIQMVMAFPNSYKWGGGGIPRMDGSGMTDVVKSPEWYHFLDEPFSPAITDSERRRMATHYSEHVFKSNYAKFEFWDVVRVEVPQLYILVITGGK